MKIARFLSGGRVVLGRVIEDAAGAVSGSGSESASASTSTSLSAHRIEGDLLSDFRVTDDVVAIEQLLPPIVPTDILCIGVNYRAHAAETGSAIPQNPMLFIKASGTLNRPGGEIVLPANSKTVDYEAELAVVIGRAARHVTRETALDYVLGYTCANDVSARDWQKDKALGGGQFARGKSFDTFCPLGPYLVTKDEIPNPNALRVRCLLNGEAMQDSSTADMIYDVPALIASLSSTLTLQPGSVILTGTPEGVGMGRSPQVWLKDGDRVVVEVQSVGRLENRCVAERV